MRRKAKTTEGQPIPRGRPTDPERSRRRSGRSRVKRHPDLRTRVASSSLDITSLRRSGVGRPEEAVDLSEPVAAAVDVDDVYVVRQAVEDRGGEDLVADEDLGPVAHVLVGGEDDRALLVARAHEAEEEVGLPAVEGPEARFVDDGQRAVQVALGLEPSGGTAASPLSTCIRSSRRKWVVLNPFLMAFTPSATARGLLPTPRGPPEPDSPAGPGSAVPVTGRIGAKSVGRPPDGWRD